MAFFDDRLAIFGQLKHKKKKKHATGEAAKNAHKSRGRRARFVFNCGQIWSELKGNQARVYLCLLVCVHLIHLIILRSFFFCCISSLCLSFIIVKD